MGNSLGRAPLGRSDAEATIVWMEGKLWEIAWVDLGRAPWGRSATEATIGCTEEKPWEIAWGELRVEGAIRKRGDGGRGGNRGK